jgi:Cu(I)/Ag(I) efflux system membrane fusion protein
MDLIPVETGGGGGELDPNQIRMSETAIKLAGVQTTPVTRVYAVRSVRMVGKLDYDETKVSYITAWVPGRLDSLFVDYTGATVTKGDHMVDMYSPELVATQEELLQAKKAVATLNGANSPVLKSTANETLKSAREKLRLYGLSDMLIQDIEDGNAPRDHLTITAPASGVVVHKDAKEGMYVSTGTRIYTIADLNRLWVLLEAYESDLPWLRYGQHITFTSPSFPGKSFDAITSFIDPVVNPQTRTVNIRAVVNNKDMRLKPEMFVSATVQSTLDSDGHVIAPELAGKWIGPMHPEIVKDGPGKCDICGMDLVPAETLGYTSGRKSTGKAPLLIPASAPLITGTRAVVYVQVSSDEGVVFEGREVTLGPRAGDYYVVKEGLSEGDKVVTNGAFKIDSELQIQAKPSMMSPKGGTPVAGHQHEAGGNASMKESEMNVSAEKASYVTGSAKRLDDCEEAQAALVPVYDAYFNVQMTLANDDLSEAKDAYSALNQAVSSMDMSIFKDEAHTRWMKIARAFISGADAGKSSSSIAVARDAFYHVSLAAIEMHDTFGHAADAPYFLTFCPMARDNAGAYWLQKENVVWNSFYGEAMLRCGEIKQELHAGNAVTE